MIIIKDYKEFIYKKPGEGGYVIGYKTDEELVDFKVLEVSFSEFNMNENGEIENYTIDEQKDMFECKVNNKGSSEFHFAHGIEFISPREYASFVDVLNQLYDIAEKILGEKADFDW